MRIVFSFKNGREKRILISSNIPGSIYQKTLVNFKNAPNPKTTFVFWFAHIIPGSEVKGRSSIFFLYTSPPKFPNDRSYFGNKSFGEEYNRHVIDGNGAQHRVNVNQTTSVIEFVCFNGRKLGSEFSQNETVSLISILMIKN